MSSPGGYVLAPKEGDTCAFSSWRTKPGSGHSWLVRLRSKGSRSTWSADGEQGIDAALARDYELVILDLLLPGRDGLDVLQELHERRPGLPVLILSARSELATKLRGFELGAVDYLAKPFSLDELFARIRVQMRAGRGAKTRRCCGWAGSRSTSLAGRPG